jgi:hypothetical protein
MSQSRASDALPITQAPGVGSDSPGMYASLAEGDTASLEDSLAEEGQAVTPVPQAVTTPMLHTKASPVVSALKGERPLHGCATCLDGLVLGWY